jgi:hypothetical protein
MAEEKGLNNEKRSNVTIYIEDLAEFARIFLITIEITFEIG